MDLETDLFGEPVVNGHKSVLARTFDYPPFSVLNAREGWWQERKRQWLALGIKSELGRGGDLIPNGGVCPQKTGMVGGGADMGQLAAGDAKGPKLLPRQAAAAFDVRGGLATWQRDKRR